MDRDLGINLARVTEAAALASAKYLGKGEKEKRMAWLLSR